MTPRLALQLRRLAQLYAGLALYGLGVSLQVTSGLGNDPWDVFHQGLSRRFGLSIGTWIIIVGALVMLLWIPLRQRPGIGTISNVVFIGLFVDLGLLLLPDPHGPALRWTYLITAILVGGFATSCYIGAGLGPGPRDGLMTALASRGRSIRVARTSIELTVLAAGWLLGGTVGAGTLIYAVSIGPLAHVLIPLLRIDTPETAAGRSDADGTVGADAGASHAGRTDTDGADMGGTAGSGAGAGWTGAVRRRAVRQHPTRRDATVITGSAARGQEEPVRPSTR